MKLKKYIKENNINIVMSFLYRPNYINILAKIFGSSHKSIINIRSTTFIKDAIKTGAERK